jgi:TPR repeat protein
LESNQPDVKRLSLLVFLAGVSLAVAGPADDPVEQKKLGDAARARQDFVTAERHYRQAADQGHLDAVVALADVLMRDVPVKDATGKTITQKANANEAVQWYVYALSQGRDDVYFQLACCYDSAWGVKRDLIEALKWYSLVAREKPAAKQRFDELVQTLTPGQVQEAQRRAKAYQKPAPARAD